MVSSQADHNKLIIDQFTHQAAPFASFHAHSADETLRLILDRASISSRDVVLDVACGPGIVACAIASVAAHVTGVDLVPAMLEQARSLQEEKQLTNVDWRLGDVTNLEFDNDAFSLVVTRYSFHHLIDPERVFREMIRVCRPNGRVVVIDVTPDATKRSAYDRFEKLRDPSHTKALTIEEFQSFGNRNGLALESHADYGLEVDLEELLERSHPSPGDAESAREMVRKDIGADQLGIDAKMNSGRIRFRFPVSLFAWRKPPTGDAAQADKADAEQ